jgi:hypothetical protein
VPGIGPPLLSCMMSALLSILADRTLPFPRPL